MSFEDIGHIPFATLNLFKVNGIFWNRVLCSAEHALAILNNLRSSTLAESILAC